MYEEEYLLDALVHLTNGWLSFRYADSFLQCKYENRKRAMYLWMAIYAAGQLCFALLSEQYPLYDRFTHIIPYLLLLTLLQKIFFEKNRPRQAFVIASFIAGWEILRFLASPMAHAILSLWSPFWGWMLEYVSGLSIAPLENILEGMLAVNRVAIFLVLAACRGAQLGLLALYLHLIRKNFIRMDYALQKQDTVFLVLPCITVLCIDLTMRLMAYSVDNSAMMLIYERVPGTLLLLPLVSLLLLGIVVSSVILFQNLVQYKDEERKRLLLENRVVHVHREIEELTDIYGDIRGLRHDLRNHINNIAAYVRRVSPEEAGELEAYLKGMEDTVARLDFADQTGNPITDIILHQARQTAKKKNIPFHADFHYPKDGRLDVYDVSILLNNALQNALEACEKLSGARNVSVRSYEKGSLFFLEVENDFNGELHWASESDIPATTKEQRHLHGIGLANMKRCAQKYNGDLDIQIQNTDGHKRFCLTVMLYKKSMGTRS